MIISGVLLAAAAGSAGAASALKPPFIAIQRVGNGIVFVPATVRAPVITAADCSDTDYSVMIRNETNKTLTLTFRGQEFETLTSAEEFTSCEEGAGRIVLKVQGHPQAKLVIHAVVPGS